MPFCLDYFGFEFDCIELHFPQNQNGRGTEQSYNDCTLLKKTWAVHVGLTELTFLEWYDALSRMR